MRGENCSETPVTSGAGGRYGDDERSRQTSEVLMLHPARTVTTPLTLFVSADTGDAEIAAEFRYDPNDPLAVSLVIGLECAEPVVWVFGRDLLADGVSEACGLGDITVEPASDTANGTTCRDIRITLATDRLATMIAARDKVVEFLVESFTVVPSGCELDHIDFDAEIEALIA
jgi:hypothetical protein